MEALIEGYGLSTLVDYIPNVSMGSEYYDYNQTWFNQIGFKLITTMIVYIFSPSVIEFVLLPCRRCSKYFLIYLDVSQLREKSSKAK